MRWNQTESIEECISPIFFSVWNFSDLSSLEKTVVAVAVASWAWGEWSKLKNVCHSGLPGAGHWPDVCLADGDGEADEADGGDGGEDDCDAKCGETSGEGEDTMKKDCATNGDDH